jgi:hypothetical protein
MPDYLPAGPQMRSTEYYRIHNAMIDRQSQARPIPLGGHLRLASGIGSADSIYEILEDPMLAHAVSDEGPLRRFFEMWSRERL